MPFSNLGAINFHWVSNSVDNLGGVVKCEVKTMVHEPPNLIPGIDIRCLAKKTKNFGQKKVVPRQYYFLTPRGPPWVTKVAQSGC